MRLQLTLALAILALPRAVWAQNKFDSEVQVYVDDDHTSVVSPVVHAQADVTAKTNVSAGYVADVVTSASVDVVSQASPKTIHDIRHQASLSMTHALDATTLSGGYVYSTENDYASHVMSAGVTRDLAGKNTTLGINYALSLDTVGRVDDHNFERSLTVHTASLVWTQVLSPELIAQLSYTLALADGYQASPYRFVPVRMDEGLDPMYWVPETNPEQRWRHAGAVAANWMVADDAAVQGDYRFYRDTWGIASHTVGTRIYMDLKPGVELRIRNRFYTQSGASFYQSTYTGTHRYMTVDRELSALWSNTVGAKLMIKLNDWLEASFKLDAFYYRYPEFPALSSRLGANIAAGLHVTY